MLGRFSGYRDSLLQRLSQGRSLLLALSVRLGQPDREVSVGLLVEGASIVVPTASPECGYCGVSDRQVGVIAICVGQGSA